MAQKNKNTDPRLGKYSDLKLPKVGKVLWWDRRDKEGIIVDGLGNQYYFNKSVLPEKALSNLKDGLLVSFESTDAVPHLSCAKDVSIVASRSRRQAEQAFIGNYKGWGRQRLILHEVILPPYTSYSYGNGKVWNFPTGKGPSRKKQK